MKNGSFVDVLTGSWLIVEAAYAAFQVRAGEVICDTLPDRLPQELAYEETIHDSPCFLPITSFLTF